MPPPDLYLISSMASREQLQDTLSLETKSTPNTLNCCAIKNPKKNNFFCGQHIFAIFLISEF